MDRSASPDERAARWVNAMTEGEKLAVITGYFGVQADWNEFRFPEARPQSAGFVRGVSRLALTPQWQCDAGLGVATQGEAQQYVAVPGGAASFRSRLAQRPASPIPPAEPGRRKTAVSSEPPAG